MSKYLSINFVKQLNNNNINKSESKVNDLNGRQIKEFYEKLISETNETKISFESKTHSKQKPKQSLNKNNNKINNNLIKFESISSFVKTANTKNVFNGFKWDSMSTLVTNTCGHL